MCIDRRLTRCIAAAAISWVLVIGLDARAQAVEPQLAGPELVAALKTGGLVILMRHMSTDSFVPEEGLHLDADCQTQRNLDERGRGEGKAIGEAIVSLGIPIGDVWSSPYCRCIDTGMLVFGKATPRDELAVFDVLTGAAKDARAKKIRAMINTPPAANQNTVLIAHTGSLLYTFGLKTRPEGIAHVFRPAEFGLATYVGRLTPQDWVESANTAATDG